TDLLLFFLDDVHRHENVECVVDTATDVLRIVLLFLVVLRRVRQRIKVFGDQLVGNLVVVRLDLLLDLFADARREVTQAPGLVSVTWNASATGSANARRRGVAEWIDGRIPGHVHHADEALRLAATGRNLVDRWGGGLMMLVRCGIGGVAKVTARSHRANQKWS